MTLTFDARRPLHLLDVANDRTLHFHAETLEFIGAVPLGKDLGESAAFNSAYGRSIIADGANTELVYIGAGSNFTQLADMTGLGGAAGIHPTLPAPTTLAVAGLGCLALCARRSRGG